MAPGSGLGCQSAGSLEQVRAWIRLAFEDGSRSATESQPTTFTRTSSVNTETAKCHYCLQRGSLARPWRNSAVNNGSHSTSPLCKSSPVTREGAVCKSFRTKAPRSTAPSMGGPSLLHLSLQRALRLVPRERIMVVRRDLAHRLRLSNSDQAAHG